MRRKVLQDIANSLCGMLVGWRMAEDLEVLAELPDGELRFDLLQARVTHSVSGNVSLHITGELAAWLKHRLDSLKIPIDALREITLVATSDTSRISTNRKRIVSFDWRCESVIATDEAKYAGRLNEKHLWHQRLSPNNALERTRNG